MSLEESDEIPQAG